MPTYLPQSTRIPLMTRISAHTAAVAAAVAAVAAIAAVVTGGTRASVLRAGGGVETVVRAAGFLVLLGRMVVVGVVGTMAAGSSARGGVPP